MVAPQWVRRIANSRLAIPAVGLLSFLDACISPILPEVILVPLCLTHPERRWWYASWCSLTSVVGAVVGYYLGFGLWEAGLREFAFRWLPGFTPKVFAEVSAHYGNNAFLWVFLAAFTPLPFKIFTVAAGVCHEQVGVWTLTTASIAGRLPRFLLEVELIHRLGPDAITLMGRHKWLLLLLAVVTVAVILLT